MSQRIFRSVDEARGQFGPAALAIGNFDGLHVGHQTLIDRVRRFAAEHNAVPAALTFDPHPAAVIAPDRKLPHIVNLQRKLELMAAAGIEHIMVLPFTPELSRLSPEEFVKQILVDVLNVKGVFVGENFRFGHKQAGDRTVLEELGRRFGFACEFLPCVRVRGQIVSSSLIRERIASGAVSSACRLLGRPFSVEGPVVSGHGIGSKQTVPTLNLRPEPNQVLPRGVFVTRTHDSNGARVWPSITNVGTRPTFAGNELTVETYLLSSFEGNAPEAISVEFRRKVRDEKAFNGPEELKQQILKDVARAQAYWRRLG